MRKAALQSMKINMQGLSLHVDIAAKIFILKQNAKCMKVNVKNLELLPFPLLTKGDSFVLFVPYYT